MFKAQRGLSRKKLRGLARFFRKELGLEKVYHIPIVHLLEYVMPSISKGFNYEIVEDRELDADAIYYPKDNMIVIRESVYNGAVEGDPRSRFTIAHEIGHAILHTESRVALARNGESIPAYMDPEWQANTFAAELLVPHHLIGDLSVEEIIQKCKVSKQVARIQKKST